MAVTVTELWDGSKVGSTGDQGSVSTEYVIRGTNNEFTAAAALDAALAGTVGVYVLNESRILGRIAEESWKGYAKWGSFSPVANSLGLGGAATKFNFDTGGGQTTVFQSLGTTKYDPSGGTAPDFGNAINVTENGPQGVAITIPAYSFSETHYVGLATVTTSYKNTLFALTGTVNSLTFKGFAAGECLFLGATGSLARNDYWEITYRFSASPNATGLSVGSITGISKDGWQYLWTKYRKTEDATAKAMGAEPIGVYVEDVYPSADHNLLGI